MHHLMAWLPIGPIAYFWGDINFWAQYLFREWKRQISVSKLNAKDSIALLNCQE